MEYNYNKFDLALMADMPFVRSKKEKKEYLDSLNIMYNELLGNDFMKQRNLEWLLKDEKLEQLKKHPLYKSPVRLKSVKPKHEKIFGDKWTDVMLLVECRDKIEKLEIVKKPRKLYKRTASAATHYGICQLCGNKQKAGNKSNLLADHGYTRDNGHYGECAGSLELPLEKSCDLVKAKLGSYEIQLEHYRTTGEDRVRIFYGKKYITKNENVISGLEWSIKILKEKIGAWKEKDQEEIQYLD